jgi:flavin reductase (DIM6/NTAB) family NADH-FMN oxidoreductase RutF
MDQNLITAFSALTTGIYVMTVRDGDRRHGMSSSWVTQVSGDPPLLMAAVDQRHFTHAILARTRRFALNVLGRKGRHLEDYFFSKGAQRPDNLDGIACDDSADGLPLLREAMLNIACEVREQLPAGDHTLFVAAITEVVARAADQPLTSQDLRYVYVGTVIAKPHDNTT